VIPVPPQYVDDQADWRVIGAFRVDVGLFYFRCFAEGMPASVNMVFFVAPRSGNLPLEKRFFLKN